MNSPVRYSITEWHASATGICFINQKWWMSDSSTRKTYSFSQHTHKSIPHEYAKYCTSRLLFFINHTHTQLFLLNDLTKVTPVATAPKRICECVHSTVSFYSLVGIFTTAYNFFPPFRPYVNPPLPPPLKKTTEYTEIFPRSVTGRYNVTYCM